MFARGESEVLRILSHLINAELNPIEVDEELTCDRCGAVISIEVRMVFGDAKCVGCRHGAKIGGAVCV